MTATVSSKYTSSSYILDNLLRVVTRHPRVKTVLTSSRLFDFGLATFRPEKRKENVVPPSEFRGKRECLVVFWSFWSSSTENVCVHSSFHCTYSLHDEPSRSGGLALVAHEATAHRVPHATAKSAVLQGVMTCADIYTYIST